MESISAVLKRKYKNSKQDIVLHGADLVSQKGYTLVPNYILLMEGLSPYAKLIYSVLLSYAWGDKRAAFPGQERLAKDCGMGIATVKRYLKELVERECLTVIWRGQGLTNIYILHFKRR